MYEGATVCIKVNEFTFQDGAVHARKVYQSLLQLSEQED